MKKLFALLLCLLPLCAYAYDFCVDGISYNKLTSSTCEVTSGDTNYSGSVTIPSSVYYDGVNYSVSSIGSYAFYNCIGLTSITIPNSVTSIGNEAFAWCSGLTSITIPNSVTSIGRSAFYYCTGLTSITIPNSVTSIGSDAFSNCYFITENFINNSSLTDSGYWGATICDIEQEDGLLIKDNVVVKCRPWATSVTIPNSVTSIGEEAFSWCTGLTSITIPNSVTSIGNYAFDYCTGLTSITIPNSVTSIGYCAFYGCTGLTSITIPNSVTSIGNSAFSGCTGLTSITIPNSVTSIGYEAFAGCSGLTSITIPNSVTSIEDYAFLACTKLTSVKVEAMTPPSIVDNSFRTTPENKTLFVPAQSLDAYRNDADWSASFANIEATLESQEYGLYFSKERVLAGNQVSVTMNMKNAAAIASFSADLVLPEGVTIATDEFGDPAISVSGTRTNTSRHSVSTKTLADGSIRILYASQTNKTIAAGDGEVATLVLNVAKNVEVGNYPLVLKNIVMAEVNETGHKVDRMTSFLTVRTFTLGDVNDDGEINVQDLVAVVNYIMETPTAGNIAEAADLNGDGQYDAVDYVAEVNLIMSQPGANAPTRGEEMLTGSLEIPSFAIGTGETVTAEVTLTDANATYTCVQMDLLSNAALHLVDVESLQNHHSVTYQTLADGTIRILFSSMSNHAINEGQPLMRLTFTADAEVQPGDYTLTMNRGLLVTGSASSTELTNVEYSFTLNDATGIETLTDETAGYIYNLNGQLMQSDVVPSGIYVRDGKKMIVK